MDPVRSSSYLPSISMVQAWVSENITAFVRTVLTNAFQELSSVRTQNWKVSLIRVGAPLALIVLGIIVIWRVVVALRDTEKKQEPAVDVSQGQQQVLPSGDVLRDAKPRLGRASSAWQPRSKENQGQHRRILSADLDPQLSLPEFSERIKGLDENQVKEMFRKCGSECSPLFIRLISYFELNEKTYGELRDCSKKDLKELNAFAEFLHDIPETSIFVSQEELIRANLWISKARDSANERAKVLFLESGKNRNNLSEKLVEGCVPLLSLEEVTKAKFDLIPQLLYLFHEADAYIQLKKEDDNYLYMCVMHNAYNGKPETLKRRIYDGIPIVNAAMQIILERVKQGNFNIGLWGLVREHFSDKSNVGKGKDRQFGSMNVDAAKLDPLKFYLSIPDAAQLVSYIQQVRSLGPSGKRLKAKT